MLRNRIAKPNCFWMAIWKHGKPMDTFKTDAEASVISAAHVTLWRFTNKEILEGFIAHFTAYVDRYKNNGKVWNICGHENRTWTPNSLIFQESRYFYFKASTSRYHFININQDVPKETSKSSKRSKSYINCAFKLKGSYSY